MLVAWGRGSCCSPCAPVQPEGLWADTAAVAALLHHCTGPSALMPICTATTALSLSLWLTRLPSPPWTRGCIGHPQLIPAPLRAVGRSEGWGASGWQGAATADGRWGRIRELQARRAVPWGSFTGAGCEPAPAGPHHAPARPSVRAEPGRLRLTEGWGEEKTEPMASSCSQQGGVPGG